MTRPRILVTGSRHWVRRSTIEDALREVGRAYARPPVLVHGAARGADTIAAEVAAGMGWEVEPHPARWGTHGDAAGPLRNAEMVAAGANLCLAFILNASRGAEGCARLARAARIPVLYFREWAP